MSIVKMDKLEPFIAAFAMTCDGFNLYSRVGDVSISFVVNVPTKPQSSSK